MENIASENVNELCGIETLTKLQCCSEGATMFLLQDNAGSLTQCLRCSTHQNHRQEVLTRGALRLCGGVLCLCRGAWYWKCDKILLSSKFDLVGLGTLWALSSPKPPRGDGASSLHIALMCSTHSSYLQCNLKLWPDAFQTRTVTSSFAHQLQDAANMHWVYRHNSRHDQRSHWDSWKLVGRPWRLQHGFWIGEKITWIINA